MQGNGQAQNAIFRRHTGLAQAAPSGYLGVESTRKPLGGFSTSEAPKTSMYRASQMSQKSMTAETTQALPFSTALLLVNTEANASVDKRALRHAGVATVRVFTSGIAAARLLAGLPPTNDAVMDHEPVPQVVLCHATLADMSGAEFVSLVRCHPQLLDLPIITLASNEDEAQKIAALAAGYSALLVRPYAPASLRSTLLEAARKASDADYLTTASQNIRAGDFDKALAQFSLLGHSQDDPEQSFQDGMRYLQHRQWDFAIRSFQKALRQMTLKGESELGLATAWKGKGDIERYKHYLAEASQTFARAMQWHKARSVYARLLAEDPQASSPFLRMAECLIRETRFDEATAALAAGYELNPQAPVARAVARACLYTDTPEYAARRVEESLRTTCMEKVAPQLGEQIRTSMADEEQKIQERQRKTAEHEAQRSTDTAPDDSAELALPQLPHSPRTSRQGTAKSRSRKGIALSDAADDAEIFAGTGTRAGAGKPAKFTPVLAPLNPEDAETSLFYNMPGLNEALSVAKFTWKLFRATKNR